MLGLAVLVGMMAMAFVGARTAVAETTSLCDTDPGTGSQEACPEGDLVEHVHEETLSGAQATLLSNVLTVKCDVLFLGDVLGEGLANPLVIHGTFTYSNCNNNCTATEENGPAEIKVSKLGHETADVTGEGLIHVVCGALINCRYTGASLVGMAKGPLLAAETNGEVSLKEKAVNKESGSLCPKTAELDIVTTPLEATYVTGPPPIPAETTSLCDTDPGTGSQEACPEGDLVEHVHEETLSGAQATLLSSVLTVKCDVLFLGDVLGEGLGNPLIIHGTFTYSNCNNNCTATEENGPAEIKVSKLGHETADVTGEGLIHVVCGAWINCRYNGASLVGTAKGPLLAAETNGEVSLKEKAVNKESGSLCPKTAELDIVTTPLEATYVTK